MRHKDLGGYNYLYFQPKYKAQRIPEVFSVRGTCYLNQNLRYNLYLRLSRLYASIIFAILLVKIEMQG